MRQAVYERNLACLAASDPGLAARLERADAEKAARCTLSKTQKTVLTLDTEKGPRALHSLFDPEKEGRRLLETFPPEGFFVFLGFGCAYHIRPCMEKPEISRIVIVDRNIGLLKAVLGEVDVQDLLMDPRVRFLIDPKPEELRAFILEEYSPALAGDMRTVTLRPRVEQEKDFFGAAHTVIKESLQEISGDFSVQSLFGKKWFTNTLANLRAAETSCAAPASREKAIVTGAGPSLEDGIPAIRRARTESFLIATDTSLPVLLYHDLCPDMVISIDCQHIGYNHFMAGYPREVPLVLDLASPAVIRRLAPRVIF
ncbi:MAG: DUF115 domain-containing protein, partial [Spirochaetaceae bacterium]|nr:DUF115 domain-containing protein [Spirochaetaceae bacterium]